MATIEEHKSIVWAHLCGYLQLAAIQDPARVYAVHGKANGIDFAALTPRERERATQAFDEVIHALALKVNHPTTADDRWWRRHRKRVA